MIKIFRAGLVITLIVILYYELTDRQELNYVFNINYVNDLYLLLFKAILFLGILGIVLIWTLLSIHDRLVSIDEKLESQRGNKENPAPTNKEPIQEQEQNIDDIAQQFGVKDKEKLKEWLERQKEK